MSLAKGEGFTLKRIYRYLLNRVARRFDLSAIVIHHSSLSRRYAEPAGALPWQGLEPGDGQEKPTLAERSAVLLAKGLNPGEGSAEMICYELDKGGAVFSVGSITYPASLLVDPIVSRITGNVIRRFLLPI